MAAALVIIVVAVAARVIGALGSQHMVSPEGSSQTSAEAPRPHPRTRAVAR